MERTVEPMYRRGMQRNVMVHYQVHTASWVVVAVVPTTATRTELAVCIWYVPTTSARTQLAINSHRINKEFYNSVHLSVNFDKYVSHFVFYAGVSGPIETDIS
jgi:hypothetical protein